MICANLAETAAQIATNAARGKPWLASTVGEMKTELMTAKLALEKMIHTVDNYAFTPDIEVTDETLMRNSIAVRSVRKVVETAAEIAGGAAFFRGHPLEQIVRDIRALHFHPLPERIQHNFTGRLALGLEPIEERM